MALNHHIPYRIILSDSISKAYNIRKDFFRNWDAFLYEEIMETYIQFFCISN